MRHSDLLAQISLFESLSDTDRNALAERLTERAYVQGDIVFSQGDRGSSMYIVLTGAVQVFLPAPEPDTPLLVLKDLRTGEYFGELSLFDDKPRSASVRVLMDTKLLELTRAEFAEHLGRSAAAAMAILAEMSERLRETNALLSQRAAKDVVREFEENLTWGQRLADRVAQLNGSWAFILLLLGFSVCWAFLNTLLPPPFPFDGYPYQFYNLFLAVLVALQGPLIMMSQNRDARKERAQAETDFHVNLKNEIGIERLITELTAFRAETNKRLEIVERSLHHERLRVEAPMKGPGGSR